MEELRAEILLQRVVKCWLLSGPYGAEGRITLGFDNLVAWDGLSAVSSWLH